MRKPQTGKKLEGTRSVTDQRAKKALELKTTEPDSLRDSVRDALSKLSEEGQRAAQHELLSALKRAGFSIGHHLLLLGIPARTAEELTASEMGILVRYVRISEPGAMEALVPILVDILASQGEPAQRVKPTRRAA